MMKLFFYFLALTISVGIQSQTIYVATNGTASNSGTTIDLPTTIDNAITKLEARNATTIYVRGGEYTLSKRITINRSGTSGNLLKLYAYASEKPVFNAILTPKTSSGQGIRIYGNYIHVKRIEVKNAYNQGILINGNHNVVEECVSHHNGGSGISIGTLIGHGTSNPTGEDFAYNTIKNCDAYLNFSWYSDPIGGNADGFSCSLGTGKGNRFIGCRSWSNSDDGWDFFESLYEVEIDSCWTWGNGKWSDFTVIYKEKTGKTLTSSNFSGDGNGFKLGGNHTVGGSVTCTNESSGIKTLRNSVSFNNMNKGIDQNNHKDGVIVENCVSFNNAVANVRFWANSNANKTFYFKNNIAFGTGNSNNKFSSVTISINNSWDSGQPVYSVNDFVTLSTVDALAPREQNGSLPENNFGKFKSSLSTLSSVETGENFMYYAQGFFFIKKPLKARLTIINSVGQVVRHINIDESTTQVAINAIDSGVYIAFLNSKTISYSVRFVK